jgi:hypothetical protein
MVLTRYHREASSWPPESDRHAQVEAQLRVEVLEERLSAFVVGGSVTAGAGASGRPLRGARRHDQAAGQFATRKNWGLQARPEDLLRALARRTPASFPADRRGSGKKLTFHRGGNGEEIRRLSGR